MYDAHIPWINYVFILITSGVLTYVTMLDEGSNSNNALTDVNQSATGFLASITPSIPVAEPVTEPVTEPVAEPVENKAFGGDKKKKRKTIKCNKNKNTKSIKKH